MALKQFITNLFSNQKKSFLFWIVFVSLIGLMAIQYINSIDLQEGAKSKKKKKKRKKRKAKSKLSKKGIQNINKLRTKYGIDINIFLKPFKIKLRGKVRKFVNNVLVGTTVVFAYGFSGAINEYLSQCMYASGGLSGIHPAGQPYNSKNIVGCEENTYESFQEYILKSLEDYGSPYNAFCDSGGLYDDLQNKVSDAVELVVPSIHTTLGNWFLDIMKFSYMHGRRFLNLYLLAMDPSVAFWVMPITNIAIMAMASLYGPLSHTIGGFYNLSTLLPLGFMGFTTAPVQFIAMIMVIILFFTPMNKYGVSFISLFLGLVQTTLLTFFLFIYPFFETVERTHPFHEKINPDPQPLRGWSYIKKAFEMKLPTLTALWFLMMSFISAYTLDVFVAALFIVVMLVQFVMLKENNTLNGISSTLKQARDNPWVALMSTLVIITISLYTYKRFEFPYYLFSKNALRKKVFSWL